MINKPSRGHDLSLLSTTAFGLSLVWHNPAAGEDTEGFEPDYTIINACSVVNEDWQRHGLNSEVAVAFNVEKRVAVILGTWYGGENKKGIFSLMNYWLPLNGTMASISPRRDVPPGACGAAAGHRTRGSPWRRRSACRCWP